VNPYILLFLFNPKKPSSWFYMVLVLNHVIVSFMDEAIDEPTHLLALVWSQHFFQMTIIWIVRNYPLQVEGVNLRLMHILWFISNFHIKHVKVINQLRWDKGESRIAKRMAL
jgi:hypothetical protein